MKVKKSEVEDVLLTAAVECVEALLHQHTPHLLAVVEALEALSRSSERPLYLLLPAVVARFAGTTVSDKYWAQQVARAARIMELAAEGRE